MPAHHQIRAQAREVAAGWSTPDAPPSWQLTAALFQAISQHEGLLTELADLPADRLPALLASAAISFVVRRDQPADLARYFPEPGHPQPPFDAGFHPAAAAFISERLASIIAACRGHRYQMNEVARCAQVATGISATVPSPAGPIALVDLGTGAGFGLRLDWYRYVIGGRASGPQAYGLTLECEARGPAPPPLVSLPPIGIRMGIELDPVDLRDEAARAWLLACAPPEAGALARLAGAIEVALEHPAPVVAGDAVDVLPDVLDGVPPGQPVVVVDSYVAVFLPAARRARLAGMLAAAGRTRPVIWLSLDPLVPLGPHGRHSVQGLALPGSLISDYQRRGVFAVLGARTFTGSDDHGGLLARAHPSGQWIEWIG